MLLERRAELDILAALRGQASSQHGRVASIAGEAGIGKTSLLRAFACDALWGACDPLLTPRALGSVRRLEPGCALPLTLERRTTLVRCFNSAGCTGFARDFSMP